MFHSIQTLFKLLTRKDQARGIGLLILYFPCAIVEAIGVASILPFMAVASNPQLLASEQLPAWLKTFVENLGQRQMLFLLGFAVLFLLIASNILTASATWLTLRYCWKLHHDFSIRLLRKYLLMPYAYFFKKDTSALIKNIVSESQQVAENFLFPLMELSAKAIVAIVVFALLMLIDPLLSLAVGIIMAGIYLFVYLVIRKRLAQTGQQRIISNEERFKYVTAAFGGLKEVKILRAENFFEQQFAKASKHFCRQMTSIALLSRLPRYFIEMFAFGSIVAIVLYVLYIQNDFSKIIPTLGLYAFAAYRVLPSLQQIFINLSRVRIHEGVVRLLEDDLRHSLLVGSSSEAGAEKQSPIVFAKEVILNNVNYIYPDRTDAAIENAQVRIMKNQCIGFAGPTGCGKTTMLDIIIGLLEPEKGTIKVDGVTIGKENIQNWYQKIGYVPQEIFLIDDTIANNIALGIGDEKKDWDRIRKVSRIAHLHEFIENELEAQYNTIVGERGIRLSGGQKQRIGIARALYRDPDIIVFDEATNALDGVTESRVMETINNLSGKKTIIIVAHRLTTLKKCDAIYLIHEGKIVEHGTYDELIKKSHYFQEASSLKTR